MPNDDHAVKVIGDALDRLNQLGDHNSSVCIQAIKERLSSGNPVHRGFLMALRRHLADEHDLGSPAGQILKDAEDRLI